MYMTINIIAHNDEVFSALRINRTNNQSFLEQLKFPTITTLNVGNHLYKNLIEFNMVKVQSNQKNPDLVSLYIVEDLNKKGSYRVIKIIKRYRPTIDYITGSYKRN